LKTLRFPIRQKFHPNKRPNKTSVRAHISPKNGRFIPPFFRVFKPLSQFLHGLVSHDVAPRSAGVADATEEE